MGGVSEELSWDMFSGNVLEFPGHHGTLSVSQTQIGAGLTRKSSMHSLRHASTELYLKELRPTLCFGHILCAVSLIIGKNRAKTS